MTLDGQVGTSTAQYPFAHGLVVVRSLRSLGELARLGRTHKSYPLCANLGEARETEVSRTGRNLANWLDCGAAESRAYTGCQAAGVRWPTMID